MAKLDYVGSYNVGWVTADGSYGVGGVILFDPDSLTDSQWEVLDRLHDNDRIEYLDAILKNEDLSHWENEE